MSPDICETCSPVSPLPRAASPAPQFLQMSSCGSTSPSTGRPFKLEKPVRGRNSASRCIFGWTSSSKLMIFDVGWWRKALVSVRSSKFQLTVKPIKVSVIPCQSFSCCNQLKLQFQWGPKNGWGGPACVLSADSWAHIQSITRGTPSLWICYLHIKALYFPQGVFVFCLDISVFSHGLTNVEKENHNLLLVVSTFAGNPRKCGGRRPSWRPVPGTLNNCLHTTNSHPCPPPPCCPPLPC